MPASDWNDLRYFLAVRRAGSLAGAARSLEVDQTTVGRRLAALEHALAARLFDRTPDGLVLTPAGEGVLASAERVEDSVAELERKIGGEDTRLQGTVRVAASEAFATRFLIGALPAIRARHPDILLEIVTTTPVVDLARREADIAIRLRPQGTPPGQPDLVARRIGEASFGLYGSKAYLAARGKPRRIADLRGHDLVGYDEDLPPIPGVAWLRDPARGGRIVMRCQSIPSLAIAAVSGIGLVVIPWFVGDTEPSLLRLGAPVDRTEIWLVAHPDVLRTARVRAVMDGLVDLLTENRARFRSET